MLGSHQACSTIDLYTNDNHLPLSSRYKRLTDPNLLQSKPPFATGFFVIYARHNSRLQIDMKIYQKVSHTCGFFLHLNEEEKKIE